MNSNPDNAGAKESSSPQKTRGVGYNRFSVTVDAGGDNLSGQIPMGYSGILVYLTKALYGIAGAAMPAGTSPSTERTR